MPLQALADQLFIGEGTVDFGRIEERDAKLHGAVEKREGILFRKRRAIGMAHAHAAEAEGGNGEGAECAGVHAGSPGVCASLLTSIGHHRAGAGPFGN